MRPGRRPQPARQPRRAPVRVTVETIAAGGEGVARMPDGRVLFVHRTAPGDVVEVELEEDRTRWARGRLVRLVAAGPDRSDAPCPHYARCGGCTLEHLTYEAQLTAKSRIVADAMGRIGGRPIDPPTITASPLTERYRNRISFTLRRRRGGAVVAGFHALGDPDTIIDVDERCRLPEVAIARVWARLRDAWGPGASRLPAGRELRLTLRATADGAVSLLVEGGSSTGRADELLDAVDELESIWHRPAHGVTTLLAGAPRLSERWGEDDIPLAGAAFLQVNRRAAALLEEHLLALAGDVAGLRIVDAYCGVGTHARRLARRGAAVIGIELDADAVAAARAIVVDGAGPLTFLEGRTETLLSDALPAAIVILNPPRGGVDVAVVDILLERLPQRILYISCNPATLARDLQRLWARYGLDSVHAFDLFPQTAHVETVVALSLLPAVA